MSTLLKRMASWMAIAAAYLQRSYQVMQQQESASIACMEGLHVGQDLHSIAQARQAVQVAVSEHLYCLAYNAWRGCMWGGPLTA